MRMYELWKVDPGNEQGARLEDAGGPVLFWRACDAEEYFRSGDDFRTAEFLVLPVRVGFA